MLKYWLFISVCAAAWFFQPVAAQSFQEKLAEQYINAGSYEKAEVLLEESYKKQPSQNSYQNLLDCYYVQEKYKDVEKLINKHYKSKASLGTRSVELLDLYDTWGKNKQAKKQMELILNSVKENPNLTSISANSLVKKRKLLPALEVYKLGMKLKPSPNYLIQMGELYADLQDQASFFECYLQLVELNPVYVNTARSRFARATNDDPESESNTLLRNLLLKRLQKKSQKEFSNLLSWLFIQEKNFDVAFIQLKGLDKRNDGNQAELFQLAQVARKNKAFSVAIDCYEYIIGVGVESPFYLNSRKALLKTKQELLTKGLFDAEQLSPLDGEYQETLSELGINKNTIDIILDWAYLKGFYLDQTDTAIAILYRCMDIPQISTIDLAKVKMELGDLLLFQNNIWDAVLLFGQAEKAFAEDVLGQEAKFRKAKVYYYTGDFGWAQGQLDVLKGSTSKLIANDAMKLSILINDNTALDTSMEALSFYSKADLWYYQRQFEKALNTLDTLILAFPSHSIIDEVYFKKADIFLKLGEYQKASDQYQLIIDGYSFDLLGDDALFLQAELMEEQLNNKEKALEYYERLMLEYPGSSYTTTARKKFRQLRGDEIN